MPQPKRADTRYLREVAYADPSGLAARSSLYDFQQPYIDLKSEALELLAPLDGRVVGDVGCGDGRYIDVSEAPELESSASTSRSGCSPACNHHRR
jgi:hypothetical protein